MTAPAWALARAEERPQACVCCCLPLAQAGPQALRHMHVLAEGRALAWCRRCDPWADAARRPAIAGSIYGPLQITADGTCLHPA